MDETAPRADLGRSATATLEPAVESAPSMAPAPAVRVEVLRGGKSGGYLSGILRGMGITFRYLVNTFRSDGRRKLSATTIEQDPGNLGMFTVQYPEERLQVPERFRYFPMLIRDAETGEDRCTACGICAKVCPPQCIWIGRATDPETGKSKPVPEKFYIDTAICMQCGLCAEFCPFDAIKMDHQFELATSSRREELVYDIDRLTVMTTYYADTHPKAWVAEEAVRRKKADKSVGPAAEAAKREAAQKAKAAGKTDDGGRTTEVVERPVRAKAEAGVAGEGEIKPRAKAAAAGDAGSAADGVGDKVAAARAARAERLAREQAAAGAAPEPQADAVGADVPAATGLSGAAERVVAGVTGPSAEARSEGEPAGAAAATESTAAVDAKPSGKKPIPVVGAENEVVNAVATERPVAERTDAAAATGAATAANAPVVQSTHGGTTAASASETSGDAATSNGIAPATAGPTPVGEPEPAAVKEAVNRPEPEQTTALGGDVAAASAEEIKAAKP